MTKIIQITDPHLGPDSDFRLAGVNTRDSFNAVVDDACERSPDLLLITGDIAAHPNLAAYEYFFSALNDTSLPFVWLPGNHDDVHMVESVNKSVPYLKTFDIGNWRILLLDSVVAGSPNGQFGSEELKLFRQLLEQNTQEHVMVCVHHHPMSVGSAWLDKQCIADAEDFLHIVRSSRRVRSVHWGHIHQTFEQTLGGVLYASAPSTCIQFKPQSEIFALDDKYPGYRTLNLSPDGSIETHVTRVTMPEFNVLLDSQGY